MFEPHITSARPGFYAVHAHYDDDIDETDFHAHVVEAWGTVNITQEGKEEEFVVMPMVFHHGRYAHLSLLNPEEEDFVGIFFSQVVFENTRGVPVVPEDELRKDHSMFAEIVEEWTEREDEEENEGEGDESHRVPLNPTMIPGTPPGFYLRMDEDENERS